MKQLFFTLMLIVASMTATAQIYPFEVVIDTAVEQEYTLEVLVIDNNEGNDIFFMTTASTDSVFQFQLENISFIDNMSMTILLYPNDQPTIDLNGFDINFSGQYYSLFNDNDALYTLFMNSESNGIFTDAGWGCTDPLGVNYDPEAVYDDATCLIQEGDFGGDGNVDATDLLTFLSVFGESVNE